MANGIATSFTLSVTPFNINNTLVNLGGVIQMTSAYTLAGSVLTLSEAPVANTQIQVITLAGLL
jgi:hypothetical protein